MCTYIFSAQELTTEEVIKKHRCDVLYEDQFNVVRITVRQGHIMDDTIFALHRGIDERKHIRVRFVGEPTVDEGGPRREFFMLLMNAIANSSSLLQGSLNRSVEAQHQCISDNNSCLFKYVKCHVIFGLFGHLPLALFLILSRKICIFMWAK